MKDVHEWNIQMDCELAANPLNSGSREAKFFVV